MRYLILSLSCVALLAGCQSHKVVEESPATLTATLPEVDTSKAPGMLEQYHVGAFTVGGGSIKNWVNFLPRFNRKMHKPQWCIFIALIPVGTVKKLQQPIYLLTDIVSQVYCTIIITGWNYLRELTA